MFHVDTLQVLKAYLEYMTKVGVLLGGEANDTQSQMRDVIEFEAELAEVSLTLSQMTNFRLFQTERVCRQQFQI